MDIKSYVWPLLRWWWLILSAAVVAAISSFVVVSFQPAMYQSHATLVVGRAVYESNPSGGDLWMNQQLANYYSDLALREPVRNGAMQALGLSWLPQYSVRPLPNSQIVEVLVTDTDPIRAQAVANALADELTRQTPTGSPEEQEHQIFIEEQLGILEEDIRLTQQAIANQQMELAGLSSASEINDAQMELTSLETKLRTLQSTYSALLSESETGAVNALTIIERAQLPSYPVGPNSLPIVGLSVLVAIAIAGGAAYLIEYLDDSLKAPDEISNLLDAPLLGTIYEIKPDERFGAYVARNPRSVVAEAFRSLRTELEFSSVNHPLQTIFVTSADIGAGKSSVAVNLASVIAQSGKKVVLLDADLRKPSIHSLLDLSNQRGLSDVFRSDADAFRVARQWEEGGFYVITSGGLPHNPAELLSSAKMDEILVGLGNAADIVVIDGPPFVVADAAILAAKVDGVVLVVRYGHTRRGAAQSAVQHLERAGARLLGVVVNQLPRSANAYFGNYRYYYPHYGETENQKASGKRLNGQVRWPWVKTKQSASIDHTRRVRKSKSS